MFTLVCHEAGHTLLAEFRASTDRVAKVSIIPHGVGALGHTQQQPIEDRYLLKQSELLDVLLDGRGAETHSGCMLLGEQLPGEAREYSEPTAQRTDTVDREMLKQLMAEQQPNPATASIAV